MNFYHVGNRRIANYYCLFTKLMPARPDTMSDEMNELVLLLQTIMTPKAHKYYSLPHQDSVFADKIAENAAIDGQGKVRGCEKHFTSSKWERNLLWSAYRRMRERNLPGAAAREPFEEAAREEDGDHVRARTQFDREPWHLALRDLLHLTCRFWTYIRLYFQRDSHLWKGTLNALLWDPPRHQGSLVEHIASFEKLDAELTAALVLLHEGEKQEGTISTFLRRLSKAAEADPLAYADWQRRPQWLKHVLDALPDNLLFAPRDRSLAACLGRLASLRKQRGDAFLGEAWSEFGREIIEPRVLAAGQSPPSAVTDVLDSDYHGGRHHAHERLPAAILGDILGLTFESAASSTSQSSVPQEFDAIRSFLIAHLTNVVPANSPESSMLNYLQSPNKVTFDTLRDAIDKHEPASLSPALVAKAGARLKEWLEAFLALQTKLRFWTQEALPPESYELWDLAEEAGDEDVLNEAIRIMNDWIDNPAVRVQSWNELPKRIAPAILSAVMSVCLDRLWNDMNDFFLALRGPEL